MSPQAVFSAHRTGAKPSRKPWYRVLYIQVLLAMALGIVLGHLMPGWGVQMKPLGDGFIKLVKMVIAVVTGCCRASTGCRRRRLPWST